MSNIEIKETKYYNCPYCHRIIPDYAICNCAKIYNQALEDFEAKIKECCSMVGSCDYEDIESIKEQLKR